MVLGFLAVGEREIPKQPIKQWTSMQSGICEATPKQIWIKFCTVVLSTTQSQGHILVMPNPHTADADYWKKGEEATVYTNLEQCKQYRNSSVDEIINVNVFSERELTFTFARPICCRPSVCLSSVCRLSVTLVHPTQAVQIFGNISTALGTLAIH